MKEIEIPLSGVASFPIRSFFSDVQQRLLKDLLDGEIAVMLFRKVCFLLMEAAYPGSRLYPKPSGFSLASINIHLDMFGLEE
jgi:hypothetical protein